MNDHLPRLLRRSCRGPRPSLDATPAAAIAALPDTTALAELAERHRVAPWLAAAIRTSPALDDEALLRPITRAAQRQSFATMPLMAELSVILEHLNANEVPVVVLKGPGVAGAFYPGRGLRPFGDLDILVPESSLPLVRSFLGARGYSEMHEHDDSGRIHHCHGLFQRIFVHPERGHIVEVHCDHLQIGLEPVSMEQIWERSEPMQFGRGQARVLELHDLIVHLAVHLHRHGFNRLIWFKDLDLIIRQRSVDWSVVRERAEAQGCLASLAQTLALLPAMLETPLPAPVTRMYQELPWVHRKLLEAAWSPDDIVALKPQRGLRFRRAVQFAPENGLIRGGLPALLFLGRRREKLRVLAAAVRRNVAPQ
ncbi:MAG: nucleotidyltransferase family protein [Dehalococcoidia bacterium]|nr:nucleotidyltransferase family protein [Dehalococcoidia bacterium]